MPGPEDFRAYARVFYPWLWTHYVERRSPEARTVDAVVNTLLCDLRLAVWDASGEYIFAKPMVIPAFVDRYPVAPFREHLMRIHDEYVLGEGGVSLALAEATLRRTSAFVRAHVAWCR